MTPWKCPSCGKANRIVNECGCDPRNMPTPVPLPDDLARLLAAGQAQLAAERQVRADVDASIARQEEARLQAAWEEVMLTGIANDRTIDPVSEFLDLRRRGWEPW